MEWQLMCFLPYFQLILVLVVGGNLLQMTQTLTLAGHSEADFLTCLQNDVFESVPLKTLHVKMIRFMHQEIIQKNSELN